MLVLTFQIGSHRLALDVQQVREVVPRVQLQQVACSPNWLAGLLIYRGRLVPVVDLHVLLKAGVCSSHLSSRIILVSLSYSDADLIGLLAGQVAEIREIPVPNECRSGTNDTDIPDLGKIVVDGTQVLHLTEMHRLLPGTIRKNLMTWTESAS